MTIDLISQLTPHIAQLVPAASFDVFGNLKPTWGPFEGLLATRVRTLVALAWAVAFLFLGYRLIIAIAAFGKAKRGKYGSDLDEARSDLGWVAAALVGLASAGAIYSALVAF